MKLYISSITSGLLFGLGLGISGMMSPEKVKSFLDITGNWDPSLALVMGGALMVTFVSFHYVLKRSNPICDTKFYLPTSNKLDVQVTIGPALFGIGWGLSGICPGPAIANLATGSIPVIVFFLVMYITMLVTDFLKNKLLTH